EREEPARPGQNPLATRRERDALAAALEQVRADELLQALDLGADGGLRDPERVGGLGVAAQIDHSDQGPQQVGRYISHADTPPMAAKNSLRMQSLACVWLNPRERVPRLRGCSILN